jgi:hypothetical protein
MKRRVIKNQIEKGGGNKKTKAKKVKNVNKKTNIKR